MRQYAIATVCPIVKTSPPPLHCRFCRHYYISHDVRFPYGCRAMDFKSKRLPLQEVREATGRDCQTFAPKPPR
ncbi:hypothetical protein ACFPAG_15170 [Vogesella sp. GCM10023246]|uniref:Uracil-DNA glycosylase n=1 Tax=Vogesella oryzagri TaxID=3160864 RepID=A0ABV1M6X9_9NEIS